MFGTKVEDHELVPIVGDGAIGNAQVQNGRLVPVLIVDCANHPALEALIHAHKDSPPGDAVCSWGWKRFSKKEVFLTLHFKRPVETRATIAFQVAGQGALVESIINARGLYVQPLSSGSRVSEGLENPKILVEVPPSATFPIWAKLYRSHLEAQYRANGLNRKQAKAAAQEHLTLMRQFQLRRGPSLTPKRDA